MLNVLAVAAGGAIGASLRYVSGLAMIQMMGSTFPWGTLFVNVAGSFLMGYIAMKFIGITDTLRLFLLTGLLGGFTTFSAFSLDFFNLIKSEQSGAAFFYVATSVLLAISALWLGAKLAV